MDRQLDASMTKGSVAESGPPPLPSLSLPKGGGAIRGIGEKFAVNSVSGTGSLSLPIYASPGRSGFGPDLSLSYNSGGGNTPFGFGWSLSLPAITRKTDKGLPQYQDAIESDTFLLSGAEDLVPALVLSRSAWIRDISSRTLYGQSYTVEQYRPRVEGLFARIERWTNLADGSDTFWRSISGKNVTSWYGRTAASRIADPADPTRIFSWLIDETFDAGGERMQYAYKPEDSTGVDLSQIQERNRTPATRSAGRYIKNIFYGNRTPYHPDLSAESPAALPTDWCFQLVFDYGEHALVDPVAQENNQPWNCRLDPFSTYRPTFEVRTYRLCRRVLMFHSFPDDPAVGASCLVASTDLTFAPAPPADQTQPYYSYLISATRTGYLLGPGGYAVASYPSLEFTYTQAAIDETVRTLDPGSLRNLPGGLYGSEYRWADLDGEGVAGILTEQGGSWFYKPNLSPANQQTINNQTVTLPRFGATECVARVPSLAALNSGHQKLLDLSGDGMLSLVAFDSAVSGYFERTQDADWAVFETFPSMPLVDWENPNLRFIDLTGDGFADLVISENNAFVWHTSLSTDGFGTEQRVAQAFDEEQGPRLVFADSTETIFLADLSGDGLTDLVRIRNGEVCYWPNLGYGRFGAKITMGLASCFDRADLFDPRRIRLADIDGSGTADILYLTANEVDIYFNQSGNGWGPKRVLEQFPPIQSQSSTEVLDLLGSGTTCLVWSSALPGQAQQCMRYIDLMGGQKPHLLTSAVNNLGAETQIAYAPSTRFYIADKLAGTPWITRLPFPVQVVESVQTIDYISLNRFTSRYSYHHGYYDGVEREFRGFGRVDQWDTEDLATLSASASALSPAQQPSNEDAASSVPPIWTRTWFHTGAYTGEQSVSTQMQSEYYLETNNPQPQSLLLDSTILPTTILLPDGSSTPYDLSNDEMRQACRALRGSLLRQEVYALDIAAGDPDNSSRPYTVAELNFTIETLQPQGINRYGVFFAHPREEITFSYERKLYSVAGLDIVAPATPGATQAADPRVQHTFTLAVDAFGNVLETATVGYGRRFLHPSLAPADQLQQTTLLATCSAHSYTNGIVAADAVRTPLPSTSSNYQLLQLTPPAAIQGTTNLFPYAAIASAFAAASAHDVAYEDFSPGGLMPGQVYRRLLYRDRTLYRPNDFGAAVGDERALLPLGQLQSLALPGCTYKLACNDNLITAVYQRNGAALLPTPATILGSVQADGGGFVDLEGDGNWWQPAGRTYFIAAPSTPAAEQAQALANFFQPCRLEDPFGNISSVNYDSNSLLPVVAFDAAGNSSSAAIDYRVLAPSEITDPNGNRTQVQFDILGMVCGTAVMGKSAETLGDSFTTFAADLAPAQIDAFFKRPDPATAAVPLLGTATTRIVYDLLRFMNSSRAAPTDPTQWQPAFASTIARTTHESDLSTGETSQVQINFNYSDGFGREIQKKVQAAPGPAVDNGPQVDPRWVGSGWTVFNNKGKPIRKYEPFFSQLALGHQFEFGSAVGVSAILCYDPPGRVVATIQPNHTFEKVVFDPWSQASWDVNDNVLLTDPSLDPDVGGFIARLPASEYTPTWYTQRTAGTALEQDAAAKAAVQANTPAHAYFDTLGRTFLSVADNGAAGKYATRSQLDIQGNVLAITDALGREVLTAVYDMLNTQLTQASMEAGQRWMLNDCTGKSIRAWDSRGHNMRSAYDVLRRPTAGFVLGTDPVNSDPRTTAAEVLIESTVYGESQPSPEVHNLRTRVFQHCDSAGVVTNTGINPVSGLTEAYDFKGNLLRNTRGFVADYKNLPDLTSTPVTPDTFAAATTYDALNRAVTLTTPDNSVATIAYNEASLPLSVNVNLRGAAAQTSFVNSIDYNAKAQRLQIAYGNGVSTSYTYDELTFRLTGLTTTRPSFPASQQTVQDLAYTYDPVGNITHIQDNADIQNVVFFRNRRVEPSCDYTYDAIYRLIEAKGRELLGLTTAGIPLPPTPTSYNDVPRAGLLQSGDGIAMGIYDEQYQYDAVGNFLKFIHKGSDPANPGWSRSYTYNEPSLLEPGKVSNRLSSTAISGNQPLNEPYTYDPHGNMTSMPQLQAMQWDFKDQLYMTRRQAVNASDSDGTLHQGQHTYYVYNAGGERVRKATVSGAGILLKQRFYLGGCEIYQEYTSTGTVSLERQTLHVMDDKQRIALIETTTVDVTAAATSLPSTATRYQFSNHLGTACLELDGNAAVISYEEYYPYGSTSYQAGRSFAEVSLKRYRYTGKEKDDETGFYYHGARYYAPWLGRWTACDPMTVISATSETRSGPSPYTYVKGNPVMRIDPDGAVDTTPYLSDYPDRKGAPPDQWLISLASDMFNHGVINTLSHRVEVSPVTDSAAQALKKATDFSHFTEVGTKRQAALASISPFPLPYRRPTVDPETGATDYAGQADWDFGQNVMGIFELSQIIAGGIGPPGGSNFALAPVSGAPQVQVQQVVSLSPLILLSQANPPEKKGNTSGGSGKSDPRSPESKANSAKLRREFMSSQLKSILGNIKAGTQDLLAFLVDPSTGKWKATSHLSEEPAVQAGHQVTRASGEPEVFGLEDAFENQRANWSGERQGAIFYREMIDIGGHPVEKVTAQGWEAAGLLPKDTVSHAQQWQPR